MWWRVVVSADAYYRVSRNIAVVTTTFGPGSTNTMATSVGAPAMTVATANPAQATTDAFATARAQHVPVVLFLPHDIGPERAEPEPDVVPATVPAAPEVAGGLLDDAAQLLAGAKLPLIGAAGVVINTMDDLDQVQTWVDDGARGTLVVDLRISRNIVAPYILEIIELTIKR